MTASKNKPAMTTAERAHVNRVKELACSVCDRGGPSQAHEPVQGLWFISIALCQDCHTHPIFGMHGQKRNWVIYKMNEWSALNKTLSRVYARRNAP